MPLAVEVNAYLHDGETRKAEALGVLLQVNLVHGGLSALVQLQLHDIEVSLLLSSKSRSFFSMCLAVLMSNTYLPTLLADTKKPTLSGSLPPKKYRIAMAVSYQPLCGTVFKSFTN